MPSIVKYMELRSRFLSIFFIQAMVRIMTPRYPFNKPSQEVIVDLLNQVLIKNFPYSAVGVTPVMTAFAGSTALDLPPLAPKHLSRERASFIATVEGYRNSLHCNYYKLNLNGYIRYPAVVGSSASTEEQILTAIQERYSVHLDPDEVVVDVFGLPMEDGSHRCVVRPMIGHLVWEGPLEVLLVDAHHIALVTPVRELGALDLFGDPDIAQLVAEQMLTGFDEEDLVETPEE